jgi:hypothetical protein
MLTHKKTHSSTDFSTGPKNRKQSCNEVVHVEMLMELKEKVCGNSWSIHNFNELHMLQMEKKKKACSRLMHIVSVSISTICIIFTHPQPKIGMKKL